MQKEESPRCALLPRIDSYLVWYFGTCLAKRLRNVDAEGRHDWSDSGSSRGSSEQRWRWGDGVNDGIAVTDKDEDDDDAGSGSGPRPGLPISVRGRPTQVGLLQPGSR